MWLRLLKLLINLGSRSPTQEDAYFKLQTIHINIISHILILNFFYDYVLLLLLLLILLLTICSSHGCYFLNSSYIGRC